MKIKLLTLLTALVVGSLATAKPLFNGKDLTGWKTDVPIKTLTLSPALSSGMGN
jgi:hypothetical protein